MLIKLVTTKMVSENATALQAAVQFHNEHFRCVRPVLSIAELGQSALMEEPKKMTGDSNEATRTRSQK